MAKKKAEYEIPGDGDCSKCETIYLGNLVHDCLPFYNKNNPAITGDEKNWTQLQQCKDFLAIESNKIDCQDCINFWCKTSFGELEPRCAKDIEQYGEIYNWYAINCKFKEE